MNIVAPPNPQIEEFLEQPTVDGEFAPPARRTLPWVGGFQGQHNFGVELADVVSPIEALRRGGLDFTVETRPVLSTEPGRVWQVIPGAREIVRSDTGVSFGVVGRDYRPFQYHSLIPFMEALLERGAIFEKIFSLRQGAGLLLVTRLPEEIVVGGNGIGQSLVLMLGHVGMAGRLFLTPYSIFCTNVMTMALQDAKQQWTWRHVENAGRRAEEAYTAIERSHAYLQAIHRQAQTMLTVPFGPQDWMDLTLELLPAPTGAARTSRSETNWERRWAYLRSRIEEQDLANFRHTGWGAYQAVSDFVSHSSTSTSRLLDVVRGDPLLDRARRLIMATR